MAHDPQIAGHAASALARNRIQRQGGSDLEGRQPDGWPVRPPEVRELACAMDFDHSPVVSPGLVLFGVSAVGLEEWLPAPKRLRALAASARQRGLAAAQRPRNRFVFPMRAYPYCPANAAHRRSLAAHPPRCHAGSAQRLTVSALRRMDPPGLATPPVPNRREDVHDRAGRGAVWPPPGSAGRLRPRSR